MSAQACACGHQAGAWQGHSDNTADLEKGHYPSAMGAEDSSEGWRLTPDPGMPAAVVMVELGEPLGTRCRRGSHGGRLAEPSCWMRTRNLMWCPERGG